MPETKDQKPDHPLTMYERWDADAQEPMGVWFNSVEDLQKNIVGFNKYGVPTFAKEAGTADVTEEEDEAGDKSSPNSSGKEGA